MALAARVHQEVGLAARLAPEHALRRGRAVSVVDPVPPCPDWTVVGVDRAPVEREDASAARMKPGMRLSLIHISEPTRPY